MRWIGCMVLVVACGGSSAEKDECRHLIASIGGVGLEANQTTFAIKQLKWEQDGAKISRSAEGVAKAMTAFTDLTGRLVELTKAITNQPRVPGTGKNATCHDEWYATTDKLKDALDPFVVEILKPSAGPDHRFEDRNRVQIAWMTAEKQIVPLLCELDRIGVACTAVAKEMNLTAPGLNRIGNGICK